MGSTVVGKITSSFFLKGTDKRVRTIMVRQASLLIMLS
jgi:hypothetical protein